MKDRGTFVPASVRNPAVPEALDRVLGRMLARSPRERYQTASELIVDLERCNLAAPVPSFVDPDLALQDPLVQARLTAPPHPTRLDIAAPPRSGRRQPTDVWYLRYRNQDGRWCKARATTRQILSRLRDGRLDTRLEVSRQSQGEFRSLAAYAEFRQAVAESPRDGPTVRNGTEPAVAPRAGTWRTLRACSVARCRRTWLLPLGLALLAATVGLASWFTLR
jgi:hypothetical protein